jgi:hypothetical protein
MVCRRRAHIVDAKGKVNRVSVSAHLKDLIATVR